MSPNFVLLGLSLLHGSSASRGDAELPESRRRALPVYVYLDSRKSIPEMWHWLNLRIVRMSRLSRKLPSAVRGGLAALRFVDKRVGSQVQRAIVILGVYFIFLLMKRENDFQIRCARNPIWRRYCWRLTHLPFIIFCIDKISPASDMRRSSLTHRPGYNYIRSGLVYIEEVTMEPSDSSAAISLLTGADVDASTGAATARKKRAMA